MKYLIIILLAFTTYFYYTKAEQYKKMYQSILIEEELAKHSRGENMDYIPIKNGKPVI